MSEHWLNEIGPGWRSPVAMAICEIEAHGGVIKQVKEKFGGLRLYVGVPEGANLNLIFDYADWAENACEGVCEECGKPGKLINKSGWYKTRCEECKL